MLIRRFAAMVLIGLIAIFPATLSIAADIACEDYDVMINGDFESKWPRKVVNPR